MMNDEPQQYSDEILVRKNQMLIGLKQEVIDQSNRRRRRKLALSTLTMLVLLGAIGSLTLRTHAPKHRSYDIVTNDQPKTQSISSQYLTIDRSKQPITDFDFKVIGNREFSDLYVSSGRCGTPVVANGSMHILGCDIN